MLIAISGIDGSGKTTVEQFVVAWLGESGRNVVTTCQPTAIYRNDPRIRDYLDAGKQSFGMFGMALFAAADRQFHTQTVVLPALTRGDHVVCNRYVADNLAWFMARGVNRDFLESLLKDVPRPDLTLLMDIPPRVARTRVQQRDGSTLKFEENSLSMMEDVRENLRTLADETFLMVDSCLSFEEIRRLVGRRLAAASEKERLTNPVLI